MLNRLVAPRKAAGHNSDNDGKKYIEYKKKKYSSKSIRKARGQYFILVRHMSDKNGNIFLGEFEYYIMD